MVIKIMEIVISLLILLLILVIANRKISHSKKKMDHVYKELYVQTQQLKNVVIKNKGFLNHKKVK